MSDVAAAPAAAPSAPEMTPNPGGDATPAAAVERRRIALADLADDDQLVGVVDGEEREWRAADVRRRLQTEDASTRRFQEAKRIAAEARQREERMARAIANPAMLAEEFRRAGMSPADFAKAMLEWDIAEANMTPDQKKLRQYERDEEHRRQTQEHQQRVQLQHQVQENARVYEAAFNDAANLAHVPNSPRVRRVVTEALVDAVRDAIQRGTSLDQPALVRIARQAYDEHASDYRRDIPDDLIMERLTPETVAKWQQRQQTRARPPLTPAAPQQSSTPRDERGRFAEQQRAANTDVNGRPIIRDAFEAMAATRR